MDLGDAPPLPDDVPSEGEELLDLPSNDMLGDLKWPERSLAGVLVEDSSDHALIPVLRAGGFGMGIWEVCEAAPLPCD